MSRAIRGGVWGGEADAWSCRQGEARMQKTAELALRLYQLTKLTRQTRRLDRREHAQKKNCDHTAIICILSRVEDHMRGEDT